MLKMERKSFRFDFNELKLSVSRIESVMGYNEGDDRKFVIDLIEEVISEAREICSIKAEYAIFSDVKFDSTQKSIEINNISFNVKKTVFTQIKKSDSAALFLSTAGEEIGLRSSKAMKERDFLKGYVYDVVGSEVVESAADLMQNSLEKSLSLSGLKITNRYSPGYCGWDVGEQQKLFQLLPDNSCGIRLTTSSLMDPVKSVSGIIGIGANVKSHSYTCQICDMSDCIYRKARMKSV
jgi:hypothetical protein